MSTSVGPLELTPELAGLLKSALPHLSEAEVLEVEALVTGTELPTLQLLQADPARIFADKQPDSWQAGLLRGDSDRILLCCSRQSGKSTTAAALALKAAMLHDGALVLLLSPTLRQSGELFRDKVLRLYGDLGKPVGAVQTSALQITLSNGSRIISLPGDEETIRGYSGVTLLVIDEASRVSDDLYRAVRPMLAVSGGRLVALSTPFGKQGWFYREWHSDGGWERVMIPASQCPRIPAAFLEDERRAMGAEWFAQEYECSFTDGTSSPLFPSDWLTRAATLARGLAGKPRKAAAMGCDPAEGGDSSAWAVVDEYGLIALLSLKTPDTSVIPAQTLALMRQYAIQPERVAFDRGGGGKQHADRLRDMGYNVRTVAFGESVSLDPKKGANKLADRIEVREERYAFANRRAQLYVELSFLLDPAAAGHGFAIPAEYAELRRQLSVFPKLYDKEGRYRIPAKNKTSAESKERSLVEMLGNSPDEADAVCLGVFAMQHEEKRPKAWAF